MAGATLNGSWQKAFLGMASLLAAGLLGFLAVIDGKVDDLTEASSKMDGRLMVLTTVQAQIKVDVASLKAFQDLKQANEDVTDSRRLRELEARAQGRPLSTPPPTFEEPQ